MNHKNFHLTQISDKTNDMIFLKSPETLFLGYFWPFLVIFAGWRFFPKNPALSHITIYGPLTACYVSEKNNEPIPWKVIDKQKDGGKDRHTLFFRTLPAENGGPKNLQSKIGLLVSIRGHVHLIIAVLGLWHPHLQLHETTLEKMKTE